jgi:hypothetical protein
MQVAVLVHEVPSWKTHAMALADDWGAGLGPRPDSPDGQVTFLSPLLVAAFTPYSLLETRVSW